MAKTTTNPENSPRTVTTSNRTSTVVTMISAKNPNLSYYLNPGESPSLFLSRLCSVVRRTTIIGVAPFVELHRPRTRSNLSMENFRNHLQMILFLIHGNAITTSWFRGILQEPYHHKSPKAWSELTVLITSCLILKTDSPRVTIFACRMYSKNCTPCAKEIDPFLPSSPKWRLSGMCIGVPITHSHMLMRGDLHLRLEQVDQDLPRNRICVSSKVWMNLIQQ